MRKRKPKVLKHKIRETKYYGLFYTLRCIGMIACKILRVIFAILRTGRKYDPEKMLKDIRHPEHSTPRQHKPAITITVHSGFCRATEKGRRLGGVLV